MRKLSKEVILNLLEDYKTLSKKELLLKYNTTYRTLKKIISQKYDLDQYGIVYNNSSILRKIEDVKLIEIVNRSRSYSEVIRNFDLIVVPSYLRLIKQIIIEKKYLNISF